MVTGLCTETTQVKRRVYWGSKMSRNSPERDSKVKATQQGEVAVLGTTWRHESTCMKCWKCDEMSRVFGTASDRRCCCREGTLGMDEKSWMTC